MLNGPWTMVHLTSALRLNSLYQFSEFPVFGALTVLSIATPAMFMTDSHSLQQVWNLL